MKYYLIEIADGDDKIKGFAIYSYDNYNSAAANFHSKMGSAMKSNLYDSELLMVIADNGMVLNCEKYIKPTETQEES